MSLFDSDSDWGEPEHRVNIDEARMRLTWDKVTFQTPEHMLPTPCSVPPAPRVAPATTLALIEKHVQPELATFYPRASEAPSNNARVRTMPSASAIYACAVLDRQGLTSSELCKQRRQDAARAKDWARTSTYDPRWIPAILGLGLTISSTRPAETETVPQVEEDPLLQPTPSTSAVKMEDTAQSSQKLPRRVVEKRAAQLQSPPSTPKRKQAYEKPPGDPIDPAYDPSDEAYDYEQLKRPRNRKNRAGTPRPVRSTMDNEIIVISSDDDDDRSARASTSALAPAADLDHEHALMNMDVDTSPARNQSKSKHKSKSKSKSQPQPKSTARPPHPITPVSLERVGSAASHLPETRRPHRNRTVPPTPLALSSIREVPALGREPSVHIVSAQRTCSACRALDSQCEYDPTAQSARCLRCQAQHSLCDGARVVPGGVHHRASHDDADEADEEQMDAVVDAERIVDVTGWAPGNYEKDVTHGDNRNHIGIQELQNAFDEAQRHTLIRMSEISTQLADLQRTQDLLVSTLVGSRTSTQLPYEDSPQFPYFPHHLHLEDPLQAQYDHKWGAMPAFEPLLPPPAPRTASRRIPKADTPSYPTAFSTGNGAIWTTEASSSSSKLRVAPHRRSRKDEEEDINMDDGKQGDE